jgi:uncharacterized spore protein YtfJ
MTSSDVARELEGSEIVQRLADRVGVTARATAVFGEPVERDGITVIPVAKARWGFGGGSGGEAANQGSGGGGGAIASPVGFIEVRDGSARFVHARDLRLEALRLVAGAALIGWRLRARR